MYRTVFTLWFKTGVLNKVEAPGAMKMIFPSWFDHPEESVLVCVSLEKLSKIKKMLLVSLVYPAQVINS